MKTMRILAVATLAATFTLPAQEGGKPLSAVDAATKAAPATQLTSTQSIGVVDFVKAIEQYPRYIRLKGELEIRGKAAKAQFDDLSKRIDEQKGALSLISPDSEEAKDRQGEIELMEMQRRALGKRLTEKLDLENMRVLSTVYADLEVAIKKVAQARGVSIVLRMHDMADVPSEVGKLAPKTLQDLLTMYERRQVWYASDQVDLTADLIKLLMVPLEDGKDAAKAGDGKNGAAKADAKPGEGKPGEKAPANPKTANPKTGG